MSEKIEEVQYAIDAVDLILDQIAQKHTFVTMLKQMAEACEVDLLSSQCHFKGPLLFNGDYRSWLQESFSSIFRVDLNRNEPGEPEKIRSCVSLRHMQFKLSKRMGIELLVEDIGQWYEKLSTNTRDQEYPVLLTLIPVLNLETCTFTIKQL